MEIVKWKDVFGEEHIFQLGKDDDIFHIIPNKRKDNSYVQIFSKKALIQLLRKNGYAVVKLTDDQLKECDSSVCIAD